MVLLPLFAQFITQIIKEPTRYNLKSVTMGTLLDITMTNMPSKYTSAVVNQDLSDHCLVVCVSTGSAVKRPPLITWSRWQHPPVARAPEGVSH
jgi:hypothetical protein